LAVLQPNPGDSGRPTAASRPSASTVRARMAARFRAPRWCRRRN